MKRVDKQLRNSKAIIHKILTEKPECRNSDSFLYLAVLEEYAKRDESPISLYSMSVHYFLLHMQEHGFPPFETVRRNRQKIQQEYPELAPCKKIAGYRRLNEKRVRAYVRDDAHEA